MHGNTILQLYPYSCSFTTVSLNTHYLQGSTFHNVSPALLCYNLAHHDMSVGIVIIV